ncbi:PqqD family protein [Streptomyces sp. NPDC012623]|uniref:PqqD family protein n=1 Tax=unclassified Streptomyces TaxID=2593676 RepID=UPI0036CE087B
MRIEAERELSAVVLPNGHIELYSPRTGIRHECGPIGTTMWVVLQQHDWRPESAARALAAQWGTEADELRADIDAWVRHFSAAGLVTVTPC